MHIPEDTTQILRCYGLLCGLLNVMLPAPGELDDGEIIMRALLLDAAELVPQLAIRQKEAQPFSIVAFPILFQHFLDVHGALLRSEIMTNFRPTFVKISIQPYT